MSLAGQSVTVWSGAGVGSGLGISTGRRGQANEVLTRSGVVEGDAGRGVTSGRGRGVLVGVGTRVGLSRGRVGAGVGSEVAVGQAVGNWRVGVYVGVVVAAAMGVGEFTVGEITTGLFWQAVKQMMRNKE